MLLDIHIQEKMISDYHESKFAIPHDFLLLPVLRTAMQVLFSFSFFPHTCDGALQESPPLISPIRAAAVGLLELIRTGPLISMEWR